MSSKKRPKKLRRKKAKKLSLTERLQQKVAYLERKVRRYERQRFQGPVQPGKRRKRVSKTELEAIRTKLKAFLESAKRQLEGNEIASTYRSHENANQSIDAEIRIPLEDHGDIDGHFIDLEDSANWNSLGEFWMMVGISVTAKGVVGSPTIDKRPQRAWTNPVRGNRAGAAFFTAREIVTKNLEEWGAEATQIVVRVFWMPHNDRPNRPRR